MATKKTYIIGNWKMNLNVHEASLFLSKLTGVVERYRNVEVVVGPTMLALQPLSLQVDHNQFQLAAQNFYHHDHGAFTGEVSATQLRGLVQYGFVGHSERRHIFHETDKDFRAKVQAAIRNRIRPVLCIGETANEKAGGETHDILHDQITGGLANITSDEIKNVLIAYEPVWAIGTGDSAKPDDVKAAIKTIRNQIKHLYGEAASQEIPVLYGGSVNEASAADYLMTPGVDGLLIGGASLDARAFGAIIDKAHEIKK